MRRALWLTAASSEERAARIPASSFIEMLFSRFSKCWRETAIPSCCAICAHQHSTRCWKWRAGAAAHMPTRQG